VRNGEPGAGADEPIPNPIVRVLPAGTMQGVAVEAHLDAAAATCFDAVSLRPRHLRAWTTEGPGRSLHRLAARLRELSLGVAELDPVVGWSDPRRWEESALSERILDELEMAATLGAVAVTALVAPGEAWEPGPGTEGLAALCAAAADRGLLVQVEPFGWSALGEVTEAAAAIREIGAPNAGVLVDTWHLDRRGGDAATLEALAVDEILGLQVSDGPAEPVGADLQEDCFVARTWPGDPAGELQPERVLAALVARGWSGPVSVEVFGDGSGDPVGRARRAAEALDAMLVAIGR